MQTVSDTFNSLAQGSVRPIHAKVRVSFDKQFDPAITFFTLDTSLLDGPDILADDVADVLTEWDKYLYLDYSDRLISVEINREELEPWSVVQAYADVTFDNFDGYFNPNSGSPISDYILPRRPFRLLAGFGDESIPQFVGLSEGMPVIDKQSGTARFHLVDFLTYLFGREIGDTTMLINNSTGEILDYLFTEVGLTTDQYILDDTSFNRVPFFYAEKGQNLGDIIKDLIRAEQGRLFMDESGIIRYLSRQNYNDTSVYEFNEWDAEDCDVSPETDLINYVRLRSDILAEQPESNLWQSSEVKIINPGESVEVWASYADPVTDITTPVYSASQTEGSHFISALDALGTVPYTDVSVASITEFSKATLVVFENTGTGIAFLISVNLWGTPVRVEDTIEVIDFDQTSIDKYEEQPYEYTTTYIQDRSKAITEVAIMLDDYKEYGAILNGRFVGNFALQIGDVIDINNVNGYTDAFTITSITNIVAGFRFRQDLTLKKKTVRQYFILSSDSVAKSLLDGTDVLAP